MKFVTFSKGADIEDKSHNIKSSMNTFMQKINNIVDSIDYDEQKDPNRCVIQYHDSKGSGKIDTFTNSRTLRTNPDGSFDCSEQIRQVILSEKSNSDSHFLFFYGFSIYLSENTLFNHYSVSNR